MKQTARLVIESRVPRACRVSTYRRVFPGTNQASIHRVCCQPGGVSPRPTPRISALSGRVTRRAMTHQRAPRKIGESMMILVRLDQQQPPVDEFYQAAMKSPRNNELLLLCTGASGLPPLAFMIGLPRESLSSRLCQQRRTHRLPVPGAEETWNEPLDQRYKINQSAAP